MLNKDELLELIKNPDKVHEYHLSALEEAVEEYPYFQALRTLIAKARGTSEEIKTAAAFTANRSILQKVISSEFDSNINLPNLDHLSIESEDIDVFTKLTDSEEEETIVSTSENIQQEIESNSILEEASNDFELPLDNEEDEHVEETEEHLTASTSDELTSLDNEQLQELTEENDTETENPLSETINYIPESKPEDHVLEETALSNDEEYEYPVYENPFESKEEEEEFTQLVQEENSLESDDSYDELMTSLRELKKLRESYEEQPAKTEEEVKEETSQSTLEAEQPKEEIKILPDELVKEQEVPDNIEKIESKSPIQDSADREETTSLPIYPQEFEEKKVNISAKDDFFAINSLIEEIEKDKTKKAVKAEKQKKSILSGDFFALNDLLEPQTKEEINSSSTLNAQKQIIDRFIANEPQITPQRNRFGDTETKQKDLSRKSIKHKPEIASENLANILIEQGKTGKAIEIYEVLKLKYPEKSTYFAAQIQKLKN